MNEHCVLRERKSQDSTFCINQWTTGEAREKTLEGEKALAFSSIWQLIDGVCLGSMRQMITSHPVNIYLLPLEIIASSNAQIISS